MLPPHEALLAAPLLSSRSMQPGSILIVHGSMTDVQHGITVRRWHVQVMAWSSVMLLPAPTTCLHVSISLRLQGTQGRLKSATFESGPQPEYENRRSQAAAVLGALFALPAMRVRVCSHSAWCPWCALLTVACIIRSCIGRYGYSSRRSVAFGVLELKSGACGGPWSFASSRHMN